MFYCLSLWIRKPIFNYMIEAGVIVVIGIFTASRYQTKT